MDTAWNDDCGSIGGYWIGSSVYEKEVSPTALSDNLKHIIHKDKKGGQKSA